MRRVPFPMRDAADDPRPKAPEGADLWGGSDAIVWHFTRDEVRTALSRLETDPLGTPTQAALDAWADVAREGYYVTLARAKERTRSARRAFVRKHPLRALLLPLKGWPEDLDPFPWEYWDADPEVGQARRDWHEARRRAAERRREDKERRQLARDLRALLTLKTDGLCLPLPVALRIGRITLNHVEKESPGNE